MIDKAELLTHCTDEQLLLHADGELAAAEDALVRGHLAACAACRARLANMKSALGDHAQAHRHALPAAMDAAGPRALLRARLAEAGQVRGARRWRPMYFAWGLAACSSLALLGVLGFAVLHPPARTTSIAESGMLPDPGITPGSTRTVSLTELCAVEHEDVVVNVPVPLQSQVFREYGIKGVPDADYEVDYLITPGLGGADDVRNLWPEPHANTTWNSYVKDQLEDHLHRMVCDGKVSLGEAQKEIAGNWIAAYQKYFHTEQPLSTSARPVLTGLRRREFRGRMQKAAFAVVVDDAHGLHPGVKDDRAYEFEASLLQRN